MRLLVFSDIHNNIAAVRALRSRELNEYDAVVVAGDIGSEIAHDFRAVVDTFGCPAFYVHGNWDNDQPYDRNPSRNCVLLHQQVESHLGYFFTGFSGCPTHWGLNPHYLEAVARVKESHSAALSELASLRAEATRLSEQVEIEFRRRGAQILKRKAAVGEKAHRKAREELRAWRDRKIDRLFLPEQRFRKTAQYQAYSHARFDCGRHTFLQNRKDLVDLIRTSSLPAGRLIVVTHERLFKLADEGIAPLLHIFGHRHEYKFNTFLGTNYLNAAALDSSVFSTSEGFNRSPGGYCRVTIEDGKIAVDRQILELASRDEGDA